MATLRLQTILRAPTRRPGLVHRATLHSSPSSRVQYINATKADFDRIVLDGPAERIVLVDFYAEWCGPCHSLSPILLKQEAERTELDVLTIDIENEANGGFDLSRQFQVRAIPTVVAFRQGKPLGQFVGALNEGGVKRFLDGLEKV